MKIEQTEDELIISETPGCLWMFGLFFAVIGGIFVYGSLGGSSDYASQSPLVLGVAFLFGSCGVAAGVWIIHNAPITRVVIDRLKNTIVLTRWGLSGRRESFYFFDEIEGFCLIEEKDSEGDLIWSLGLELKTGETIKISSLQSHDELFKRDFVFKTNVFTGKQLPATEFLEIDGEH